MAFAQKEHLVESIAFGSHLSPLVKVQQDGGKQYWYHLDGNHWVDKVNAYAAGMFVVVKDGYYGVLKEDGLLIVPFEYDEIKIDSKYQQIHGKPLYDYVFIILKKDGKTGIADKNGKIVLPVQYEDAKGISKNTLGFSENGLWGWASVPDGNILHQAEFDYVSNHYSEDYIEIRNGNTTGLAKANGEIIIPVEYTGYMRYIEIGEQVLFVAYNSDNIAFLFNTSGTKVISGHNLYRSVAYPNLIAYRENNLWGIIDPFSKQVVIRPEFSRIHNFVRGVAVVEKSGKQGVIKSDGTLLLECEYDRVRLLSANGETNLSMGLSTEVITLINDADNREKRPTERMQKKKEFEAEIARAPYLIEVTKGGQQGIYNSNGEVLIPMGKYERIQLHYYGGKSFFRLYADNKVGLADENGNEILPVEYDVEQSYRYHNPFANDDPYLNNRFIEFSMGKEAKSFEKIIGLYDLEQNKIVAEPYEQRITVLNDRFMFIRRSLENNEYENVLYNFIEDEIQKLPDDLIEVHSVNDNRFLLQQLADKLYRLTDIGGKVLYENPSWKRQRSYNLIRFPEYKDHFRGDFFHGLKKIYADEGNLFIDESGSEKRFDNFNQVDDFYEGVAVAAKKVPDETSYSGFRYKMGLIDINGHEVLPFEFDEVSATGKDSEFLKFRKAGAEGIVRRNGTIVFEPVYEVIGYLNGSATHVIIRKNGKYGLADKSGKISVEPLYDELQINYDGEDKTWPVLVKEGEWYFFVGKDGNKYPIKAKRKG